jgi:hypothetical protein
LPDSRSLPQGDTPELVLAREVAQIRQQLADLRSTTLARTGLPQADPAFAGTLSGPKMVQAGIGSVLNVARLNSNVVAGTSLDATSGAIQIQAGTSVVTTSSTGDFTVRYPAAFPTSVVSVLAVPGDNAGNIASLLIDNPGTVTEFYGIARDANGAVLNGMTVRINWIAIGG